MKTLILVCSVLFTSAFAHASEEFRISAACRQSILSGLLAQDLALAKIKSATFYPGGSDGASSWDDEYVVRAHVVNKRNTSYDVFINLEDSTTCRVMSISKVL